MQTRDIGSSLAHSLWAWKSCVVPFAGCVASHARGPDIDAVSDHLVYEQLQAYLRIIVMLCAREPDGRAR